MKLLGLLICSTLLSTSIISQDGFNRDRYCVTQKRVFDFNTNKKLKHKEALKLLEPYPIPRNLYRKSMKQNNIAIGSAVVFGGIIVYVATNKDLRNEDFGDYNTSQKLITIAAGSSMLNYFLFTLLSERNRTKSLKEVNSILTNDDNTFIDGHKMEKSTINLQLNPSGLGLYVDF